MRRPTGHSALRVSYRGVILLNEVQFVSLCCHCCEGVCVCCVLWVKYYFVLRFGCQYIPVQSIVWKSPKWPIIITNSANEAEVMWSFYLSFCKQDNWRTRKRTSTRTWQARWQGVTRGDHLEVINFWWWSGSACWFQITLAFSSSPLRIGDFLTFFSISNTINGQFVSYLAKRLMPTR